jgi:hypothetical protein
MNTISAFFNPAKGLTAATHDERTKSLAAREAEIKAKHEATVKDLARRRGQANDEHDADIAKAREAVEAKARALDHALAGDVRTRLAAPAKKYVQTASRDVVLELAQTWRELSARSMSELGGPLDLRHLGFAFVDAMSEGGAVLAASDPDFWWGPTLGQTDGASRRMLDPTALAAVLVEAVRGLEVALGERLNYCSARGFELKPDRLTVARTFATARRSGDAVQAFDEAERAKWTRKAIAANAHLAKTLRFADESAKPDADDTDAAEVLVNPDMSVPAFIRRGGDPGDTFLPPAA